MSHLTYFKVQNFKCFDEIEVKELGQFNLIVGDNNVGKTALMEAMMVDEDGWRTLGNYYHLLDARGILVDKHNVKPFFHYLIKEGKRDLYYGFSQYESHFDSFDGGKTYDNTIEVVDYDSRFNTDRNDSITEIHKRRFDEPVISNEIGSVPEEVVEFVQNFKSTTKHFNEIAFLTHFYRENLPFVGINGLNGKELGEKFTKAWKNDLDILERFVHSMKAILPKIKDIRIGENDLLCVSIEGDKKLKPLGSLGFGSNRFIEILIALFRFEHKRLFIDEIDTGIHHSRLPEFLKTILTLAKELNVQLFMTTHSKECEEAFLKVLSEDKEKSNNFKCISLMRDQKTQKIVNRVRSFDAYQDALLTGFDLRM
jgi:AAA15 family ATPase/GTPase